MNCEERMGECLTKMVLKDSLWGYMFSNVIKKESPTIPSPMGVMYDDDSHINLLYNPILLDTINDSDLEKIIEHEGTHLLKKDLIRLFKLIDEFPEESRDNVIKAWNYGSDTAVNQLCKMPKTIKIKGDDFEVVSAEKYNLPLGQSSEWYFLKFYEMKEDQQEEGSPQNNGLVGDHSNWIPENNDASFIMKKAEKEIQDLVFKSFKSVRDKGNLPGYIKDLIESALQLPKIPYYYLIKKYVKECRVEKVKRAYSRPNKKRTMLFYNDEFPILPFPGKTKDATFNISIIDDTSASRSKEDMMEALSACSEILEKDKDVKITVIEVDTKVQDEYKIKKISDIKHKNSFKGRGGTILFPGLQRCKELKTDATIVFTDGFCDNINNIDRRLLPRKIIWILDKGGIDDKINRSGYTVRVER